MQNNQHANSNQNKEQNSKKIIIAGGVAANKTLRKKLLEASDIPVFLPDLKYCTDNAAMIASAGFFLKDQYQDTETMDVFAKDPSSIRLKTRLKESP